MRQEGWGGGGGGGGGGGLREDTRLDCAALRAKALIFA